MDFIRSHKLIVATIIIQIIALPLILLLVRQQQQTQTEAQATTLLYFEPASSSSSPINANVGDNLSVDLMLDPGQNLISFAKIEINYDPAVMEPDPTNPVVVNIDAFPVIVEGPVLSSGKIQIVLSVGSDQTNVIQTISKALTLNMVATSATNPTSDIIVNTSGSELLSIAPQDTSTENVLQSATPAVVNISAPATPTLEPTAEPTPVACVPAYDENGGSVTLEAEHYYGRTNNGANHWWTLVNGGPYPEQPGDILFMRASPNDGTTIGQNFISSSPEITYDIDFETTGTYYVYVRGSGNNSNSHVVHMGLDGNYVSTMNNYYIGQGGNNADWLWTSLNLDGTRPTVNITTPGVHTLHFWMRDSGAKIDRFRLTQNGSWTPSTNLSDKGADESTQITCPDATPTPIPTPACTQSQPTIQVVSSTTASVLPGESTQYTLTVRNQSSSGCEPTTIEVDNILNPFTSNITWNFSQNSLTLAPGASSTITLSVNANSSTTPGTYTNTVSARNTDSGLTSTTQLSLNVVSPTPTPQPTSGPTPQPTAINTPVPTLASTQLNFNGLKLHGLGAGGDNPNPTSWGTLNPLRPTRDLAVQVFDTSGVLVYTGNTTISYTGPTTGLFNGSLILPSSIGSGTYTLKITTPYYLTRLVPGFLNLIQGTTYDVNSVALVAGDVNQDNSLTVADYDLIMDCYTDLLPAKNCADPTKQVATDISDDGIVNQDDYNLFLRELSVQAGD